MTAKKDCIVLFVEGETDKEFFESLLKFYSVHSKTKIRSHKVINIKGISRFENKVSTKLKYEIIPKHPNAKIKVICCYDTDVFELGQKPPTNWQIVKKKVNELGIPDFFEVKAKQMIEDWFLIDKSGLCEYLKIEEPKKLEGRDAVEKIKRLFKRGKNPKIYQKGSYAHKFIPFLDFGIIREQIKQELIDIEKALVVKL